MTIGQHLRVLICVIAMGCITGFVLNGTEIDTDSPYIDYIKAQKWPYKENASISEVFDTHYETTYWEYFTARAGQHVVQFTGTDDEQQFVFQFVVEEDYSSFSIGALKQNNILLRPDAKWTYVKSLTIKKTSKAEEIFLSL